MSLNLGTLLAGDQPVSLPIRALVRHVVALGASGSGKTVFCKALVEEAAMAGIPAICIDPQGDLCSLALALADGPLAQTAEVVIFTPASTRGIPICADPLNGSLELLEPHERLQALSRMAQMVVSLLGFDLDADDGSGLAAVVDIALTEIADAGGALELATLAEHLREPEPARLARYGQLVDARKLTVARQRLARLDVGARRLLFHHGVPVDIELLLGRGQVPVAEGRTRISIIYLNTLHAQEDKELFVAVIADRLYRWMLDHPSEEAQALFYIDEIAPFVPPVRKPACKETLSLLFKQARKYGLSCLMATQNPGDVDYKAIGQFATWAIGRLTVRQDLKKIEPALRAMAPDEVESLMAALPARGPGEMTLLSPDNFDRAVAMRTRRLHSEHRTLDEEAIARLADQGFRDRFAALTEPDSAARATTGDDDARAASAVGSAAAAAASGAGEAAVGGGSGGEAAAIGGGGETAAAAGGGKSAATGGGGEESRAAAAAAGGGESAAVAGGGAESRAAPAAAGSAATERSVGSRRSEADVGSPPSPRPRSAIDSPVDPLDDAERALCRRATMSARDFASAIGSGDSKARRLLGQLVDAGRARRYKQGRIHLYFALSSGARPDLGLGKRVAVATAAIDGERVAELARNHIRSRLFGLAGDRETFTGAELIYRPLYRVELEEEVPRGMLARIAGAGPDRVRGTIYLHPRTLHVLTYSRKDGIRFEPQPTGLATAVDDLDGAATFAELPPATLPLDEEAWAARATPARARDHLATLFDARPTSIAPLFVPLWQLSLRQAESATTRLVTIDALQGGTVSSF